MYTRKDFSDGSLTFKPVGAGTTSGSPQCVVPGHISYNSSHMTAGRDVMPGHVTCHPMEETHAMRDEVPPQHRTSPSNSSPQPGSNAVHEDSEPRSEVLNNLTTANLSGDFPSQGAFPTVPANTDQTTSKFATDPSNLSAVPKNFASKESSAKKVASQVERVMNNSEMPSSSSNSPSTTTKQKKKRPFKLAANFPQSDTAQNTSPPSHAPNTATLQAPTVLSVPGSSAPFTNDVVSSMQGLAMGGHPNMRARILEVLREGRRLSTAEMGRRLGMEESTEELIYSLMKLVEEGGAVKRSEAGVSYWTASIKK